MIEKYRGSHVVALFFSRAIIQLMEAPRQSAVSAVVGGEKKKKKKGGGALQEERTLSVYRA